MEWENFMRPRNVAATSLRLKKFHRSSPPRDFALEVASIRIKIFGAL